MFLKLDSARDSCAGVRLSCYSGMCIQLVLVLMRFVYLHSRGSCAYSMKVIRAQQWDVLWLSIVLI